MAPRGVSTWRRPYTSIYNDNYRYGTGLYSDTLTDIEKRYSESISKTQLRSDRPDLAFSTFLGSNLTSSPAPAGESSGREYTRYTRQPSPSPTPEYTRSPTFENRLNATLQSAASALDEDLEEAVRKRIEKRKQEILARSTSTSEVKSKSTLEATEESSRPRSLYDEASSWSLSKSKDRFADLDLDIPKSKRKAGGRQTPTNGPTTSRWREKSSDLQNKVDSMENSMSNASNRLMSELSSLKSKYHTELIDLNSSVDTTSQQASELQKLCKRQARQIEELTSAYENAQKNIQEALDEMGVWQGKCKYLKKEMNSLREEVEQAIIRKSKA